MTKTITDILGNLEIAESTPEPNSFSGFDATPDKTWNVPGADLLVHWWADYDGQNSIHVQCANEGNGDDADFTMLYGYGQASTLSRARACVLAIAGALAGCSPNDAPTMLEGFLDLEVI